MNGTGRLHIYPIRPRVACSTCMALRVSKSQQMSTVLLISQTPRKPSRNVVEAKAELTFPTSALAFAVIVLASTE